MLLSKTKICAELGKIYPDFIFNTKFANSFISVIKSSILRNFYNSLIGLNTREIVDKTMVFSLLIEGQTKNDLSSFIKVDDILILEIKNTLINEFNPDYFKLKKDKTISKEQESLLISLFLFKNIIVKERSLLAEIDLFDSFYQNLPFLSDTEINTFTKYKGYDFKDTKSNRDFFSHLKDIPNDPIYKEELFHIRFDKFYEEDRYSKVIDSDFLDLSFCEKNEEGYLFKTKNGFIFPVGKDIFLNKQIEKDFSYYKEKKKELDFIKKLYLSIDISTL